MANDRIDEFDDFDFNIDDVLDDKHGKPKIEPEKKKGDRKPLDEFKQGVLGGLKPTSFNPNTFYSEADKKFPKTAGLFSMATSTLSDVERLRRDAVKDLAPTVNQLKVTGRRLLPRLKPIIPDSVYEKVYKKLEPKQIDNKAPTGGTVEEGRQSLISEQLKAIFDAQNAQDKEDRSQERIDKVIDDKMTQSRHQELHSVISDIRKQEKLRTNFTYGALRGYLIKSLELKYRHVFIAQDTLTHVEAMGKILETKLEAIKINTALPDIQKKRASESLKEYNRELLAGKAMNKLGDWTSNYRKKLMENITTKVKETVEGIKTGLDQVSTMGDMYLDFQDMEDEMAEEFGGKKESMATKGGKAVGSFAVNQLAKLGIKAGFKGIGQYGTDLETIAGGATRRLKRKVNDKIQNSWGGPWAWLADIVPTLDTERGEFSKRLESTSMEEVPFDVLTRRSIIEIIPGYLSKILKQATDIATGRNDNEEIIYDPSKEDFVSAGKFKSNILEKLVGSKKSRELEVSSSLETLLGAFKTRGGDVDQFKEAMPDLVKVITNLAKHGQIVDTDEIKKYLEGEYSESEYSDWAFKDIKDKDKIAEILLKSLLTEEGAVDIQTRNRLDKQLEYLGASRDTKLSDTLSKLTMFGQTRHMTDIMDEKGRLDHTKLRQLYTEGMGDDKLFDYIGRGSDRYSTELKIAQNRRFLSDKRYKGVEMPEDIEATNKQVVKMEKSIKAKFKSAVDENIINEYTLQKFIKDRAAGVEEAKDPKNYFSGTSKEVLEFIENRMRDIESSKGFMSWADALKQKAKDKFSKAKDDLVNEAKSNEKVNEAIKKASEWKDKIRNRIDEELSEFYDGKVINKDSITQYLKDKAQGLPGTEDIKKYFAGASAETLEVLESRIEKFKADPAFIKYLDKLKQMSSLNLSKMKDLSKIKDTLSDDVSNLISKVRDSSKREEIKQKLLETKNRILEESTSWYHEHVVSKEQIKKYFEDKAAGLPNAKSIKDYFSNASPEILTELEKMEAKILENPAYQNLSNKLKEKYKLAKTKSRDVLQKGKYVVDDTRSKLVHAEFKRAMGKSPFDDPLQSLTSQKIQDIHDVVTGKSKDIMNRSREKFDEIKDQDILGKSKDKMIDIKKAVTDVAETTGKQLSDRFIKDTAHISGPGIYVQGSRREAHIPLDKADGFWDGLSDTLIKYSEKDPKTKLLEDIHNKIEEMNILTQVNAGIPEGTIRPKSSIGKGILRIAGKAVGAGMSFGGKILSGYGSIAKGTMQGIGNLLPLLATGLGKTAVGFGKGMGAIFKGYGNLASGLMRGIGNFVGSGSRSPKDDTPIFQDIYIKGKVDPGNPVVSAKQLANEEVVYSDGSKIDNLERIKLPIMDAETGNTLITKEDLETGLVTIDGNDLSTDIKKKKESSGRGSGLGGMLMNLVKAPFKLLPGLAGGTGAIFKGMASMYGNLLMGLGSVGAGLGRFIGNKLGMGGEGNNKKALEAIVGKRLDDIYELLDIRLSKPAAGDTDGDGDREGSYEDRMQKLAESRKARAEGGSGRGRNIFGSAKSKLMGALGLGGAGALGSDSDSDSSSDSKTETSNGILSTVLGTLGITKATKWLGSKFKKGKTALKGAAKAAGKSAVKGTSKVLGKAFGKSVLKKIPLAGAIAGLAFAFNRLSDGDILGAVGEAASGIASIIPGIGTAASVAIDGALATRDISLMNKTGPIVPDKLTSIRIAAYGFDASQIKIALHLEDWLNERFSGDANKFKFDSSQVKRFAELVGLDASDDKAVSYFYTWLVKRFAPLYSMYRGLILNLFNVDPKNDSSLTEDQTRTMIQEFRKVAAPILTEYGKFIPNTTGYKTFINGDSLNTDKNKMLDVGGKAISSAVADHYMSSSTQTQIDPFTGKPSAQFVPKSSVQVKPQTTEEMYKGKLGSLSAMYESGSMGSGAVGYDSTGGTSYGKYQIASKTGTFEKFLLWCATQPGGAEVAERLRAAGLANTGGRSGSVPEEWKKLVREGKMGDLEHEFIKHSHYEPAFKGINSSEFRERIERSKALQNVLWSTAVQHGAAGASAIFNRAFSPNLDDADIIRKIYADRATKFPSSTPRVKASVFARFQNEEAHAIAMVDMANNTNSDLANVDGNFTTTIPKDDQNIPQTPSVVAQANANTTTSAAANIAASSVPTEETVKQTIVESSKNEPKIIVASDEKQTQLSEVQLAEMKQMNSNIEKLNTTIYNALGEGEAFDELNKSMKANLAKDNVVKLDSSTINAMAQTGANTQRPVYKGISVSKTRATT